MDKTTLTTRALALTSGATAIMAVGGAGFVGRSMMVGSVLTGAAAVVNRLRGRKAPERKALDAF